MVDKELKQRQLEPSELKISNETLGRVSQRCSIHCSWIRRIRLSTLMKRRSSMDGYEIGKDIQNILTRLDRLEALIAIQKQSRKDNGDDDDDTGRRLRPGVPAEPRPGHGAGGDDYSGAEPPVPITGPRLAQGLYEGGRILADRPEIREWETLRIEERGADKVAINSHVGYFSAHNGGGFGVIANRISAGPWETWTREWNDDGTVSFRASNGQYLCVPDGTENRPIANRRDKGSWERFQIIQVQGGCGIKSHKGTYFSVKPKEQ